MTLCPAPDCHREFEFARDETRAFEVPLALFERRHFYRSELQEDRCEQTEKAALRNRTNPDP